MDLVPVYMPCKTHEMSHYNTTSGESQDCFCFLLTGTFQPRLIKEKRGTLVAARGYSVDLNCQLNDSLAQVTLMQEDSNEKLHSRDPDGVKVTQSGQIFTINDVEDSDKGRYHCKVKTWVLLIDRIYPVSYGSQGN